MSQVGQIAQAFPYSSFIPFYTNGLKISNDATTPNTLVDIAIGSTLDSTGTFQISLTSPIVANIAVNGLNGLDTGTVAASTVYAIYLVADPVTNQPSGCILSTSLTGPLMPFGYSAYKLIGYITTDSMSHFLLGYWTSGNNGSRLFMYDAPQATAVTAGAATSYTAVSLAKWVPAINLTPVWIYSSYVPATAGNTLKMQPFVGTGDAITVTGQVATKAMTQNTLLFESLNSGAPTISYKVSNGSDTAAINVAGYQFIL